MRYAHIYYGTMEYAIYTFYQNNVAQLDHFKWTCEKKTIDMNEKLLLKLKNWYKF